MHLVRAKWEIHSFEDCDRFLRFRSGLKLAHNTRVHRLTPRSYAIRLYNTDILIYYPERVFRFTEHAFNTKTTCQRLNQFGPHGWSFSLRHGLVRMDEVNGLWAFVPPGVYVASA